MIDPKRMRTAMSLVFVSTLGLAAVGCGQECDAHQVAMHGDYELCVCEPNAVIDPSGVGCVPCGRHEEAKNGACVCKAGFARLSAEAACTTSSLGQSCSSSAGCGGAFPYCADAASSAGYCTSSGCTANSDCPDSYTCESAGGTHYCSKLPSGLGKSCGSAADCVGEAATFCESIQTHACRLEKCATGEITCPNEWACCDLSSVFGTSLCVAPDKLVNGDCPGGGTRVSP